MTDTEELERTIRTQTKKVGRGISGLLLVGAAVFMAIFGILVVEFAPGGLYPGVAMVALAFTFYSIAFAMIADGYNRQFWNSIGADIDPIEDLTEPRRLAEGER